MKNVQILLLRFEASEEGSKASTIPARLLFCRRLHGVEAIRISTVVDPLTTLARSTAMHVLLAASTAILTSATGEATSP
jgi:hypothetical protein